jgi:hypothetical protein
MFSVGFPTHASWGFRMIGELVQMLFSILMRFAPGVWIKPIALIPRVLLTVTPVSRSGFRSLDGLQFRLKSRWLLDGCLNERFRFVGWAGAFPVLPEDQPHRGQAVNVGIPRFSIAVLGGNAVLDARRFLPWLRSDSERWANSKTDTSQIAIFQLL